MNNGQAKLLSLTALILATVYATFRTVECAYLYGPHRGIEWIPISILSVLLIWWILAYLNLRD